MPYLFDFNEIISFDTEIMEIYRKCDEIMEKFPKIRQCVDFDLDRHALKKKELRLSVKKNLLSAEGGPCIGRYSRITDFYK